MEEESWDGLGSASASAAAAAERGAAWPGDAASLKGEVLTTNAGPAERTLPTAAAPSQPDKNTRAQVEAPLARKLRGGAMV